MDPITIITAALAAGAAAGLKPTAQQAIKDAYSGIKTLIKRKYAAIDLTPIERNPGSAVEMESLKKKVIKNGPQKDKEFLDRIKTLIDVIERNAPETGRIIAVDLKRLKAASLTIDKVVSEDLGIVIENAEFSGDVKIGEVRAGKPANSENP